MLRKLWFVFCAASLLALPGMGFAAQNPPASAGPETLSLDQCLKLAFNNSQTIKAAAKSVAIAKTAVKEVAGGFWPKLDYSISALQAEESIYPYTVSPYNLSEKYSGASISLTQPLYLGGKLTNALKLTKHQLNMAMEDERKTKQQLTFQVKQAFYQVWLAERILIVTQSSYDNLNHHFKEVDGFYQEGTASKFELLRAKVQRDSLKPPVITAQNGVKLAKLNLAILLGFPKDQPYSVTYNADELQLPEQFNSELERALQSAYQERPEMRQIKQAAEMSRLQMKLAEAGYKPNVALVGQYQEGSLDHHLSNWGDADNTKYWTLTFNVSGNLFNGFATPAKVAGAKDKVKLTAIKESELRDLIRLDVEQAVQKLQESLEVIRANQSNIDLAKESLGLTQARFDEGMATTMDIMDSQLALDHALNGYYQGVAMYLTAEAKIDLAAGKDR
jgi:outer membrane protein